MKLDATDLRYLAPGEFRVLTAVEMGSKNHEVVPTALIAQISKLRSGGINKILGGLAKRDLVARVQNAKYDGYRLTYGGYDYLAIRAMSKRDSVYSIGNQIGVGKESDIYVVANEASEQMVLKLHRLGRVSFRSIKEKRDYLGKRRSASWMYMSRLAAQKEWAFMKVLYEHGFPVPRPIDQARHCILMELIDAYPLRQISGHPNPGSLYSNLMDLIVRFAHSGLIHGDFNEFNILIRRDTGEPVVIDFPQMVSTQHLNAEWYFNRDVECIRTFFRRRFRYESTVWPRFVSTVKEVEGKGGDEAEGFMLDVVVAASGFSSKEQRQLEEYMETAEGDGEGEPGGSDEEEDEEYSGTDDGAEGEVLPEGDGTNDFDAVDPRPPTLQEGTEISQHERTSTPVQDLPDTDDESLPEADDHQSGHVDEGRAARRGRLAAREKVDVKEVVVRELQKKRAKEEHKYHSRKGVGGAGRTKGSKAKQDTRVKRTDWVI